MRRSTQFSLQILEHKSWQRNTPIKRPSSSFKQVNNQNHSWINAIFHGVSTNFFLLYAQNMLWEFVLASWALALIQKLVFKHIAIWIALLAEHFDILLVPVLRPIFFSPNLCLCYFISFFQLRSKRPSMLFAVAGQWTAKRPANEAESRCCRVKIIALLFIETGIWQHSIQMYRGVNWNKHQPAQLRLDMMMIITSPSMAMAASC